MPRFSRSWWRSRSPRQCTPLDFRVDPFFSSGAALHEPVRLPQAVIETGRTAVAWGMCFANLELQRTPAGEWLFLEPNSHPLYLDGEQKIGDPISAVLAELLLAPAPALP
jgi:hypothetical protein